MKKKLALTSIALASVLALSSCSSDSDIASKNVSMASDNFEIDRRVVFFNGITDKYLLEIQGRCSITDQENQLEVICKIGPDQFKKHFLGLSDNVSYFVEQIGSADVDEYYYRVTFKPEAIIPSVDLRTSLDN